MDQSTVRKLKRWAKGNPASERIVSEIISAYEQAIRNGNYEEAIKFEAEIKKIAEKSSIILAEKDPFDVEM